MAILTALFIAAFGLHRLLNDPNVVLLTPRDGANWQRVDTAFSLGIHSQGQTAAAFRAGLGNSAVWAGHTLHISALRRAFLQLDDTLLIDTGPDLSHWKTDYPFTLPASIPAGPHMIRMMVANLNGPPMVRVSGMPSLKWEATDDGKNWRPTVDASEQWETDRQYHFDSAGAAWSQYWPLLLMVTVGGALVLFMLPMRMGPAWGSRSRWVILFIWVILAVKNRTENPQIGYDLAAHLEYIRTIAVEHRLPLGNEQWQSFQSPLYYILSAVLYAAMKAAGTADANLIFGLRCIPLCCGVLMVEVCYRATRRIFPQRGDLQLVGTVIGGLLPMNIYMAQMVSNEPMAGLMSAVAAVLMLRVLTDQNGATRAKLGLLGVVLGLAWLTKISTLIWVVPIEIAILLTMRRQGRSWKLTAESLAIVPAVAIAVSGWYFVRNWLTIGKPFYSVAYGNWWQDPGYRTPGMFLRFGHVLAYPFYSGTHSFWDSVYGTLWGDGMTSGDIYSGPPTPYSPALIACGMWLGLVPTALMFVGLIRGVRQKGDSETHIDQIRALSIAGFSVALFLAAMLYVYLTLPIYCCAKSSYMLGTTPYLALLAAAGFSSVASHRIPRAIVGGLLFTWAAMAYCAYLT